jgi:arylamine N-acetyltransferase
MVNIVTISSAQYLVDVGFGTNGSHHPMPLPVSPPGSNSPPTPQPQCKAQNHRITSQRIPQFITSQHMYIYEFSKDAASTPAMDVQFIPAYCFGLNEFLLEDFKVMNFATSNSPTAMFVNNVVCVKLAVEDGHVKTDMTIYNDMVKYREMKDGKLVTIKENKLENEKGRLEALGEMGVQLTKEEADGIKGSKNEIMTPWKKLRAMSFEV